jgi:acetyl esterase
MPLHPETHTLLELLAAAGQPPIESQDPVTARAGREALVRPSTIEVAEVLDLDAGGIPVRLYRPPTPALDAEGRTGALLWFHGGGWVLGSIDGHDDLCRALCRRSGHAVVSVGYRLAPEDPFPAGLTDAILATRWLAAQAESLGLDPARLAIGGDSAGGNLAAVVAQLAPVPLAFQLLVYPVTDARRATDSYRRFGDGLFLTADGMAWFVEHYLSGDQGSEEDPRVSPLLAPDEAFAACPPTLVITAGCDPLRDEGAAFADRLLANGVTTTHVEMHGQIHAFFSLPEFLGDADLARGLAAEALATALDPARATGTSAG